MSNPTSKKDVGSRASGQDRFGTKWKQVPPVPPKTKEIMQGAENKTVVK